MFDVGYLRLRFFETKCKLLETGDDNNENTGDPNHENMLEGRSNIDEHGIINTIDSIDFSQFVNK